VAISEDELRNYLEDDEQPGEGEVRRVSWESHLSFLEDHWAAGQHASIFASVDGGKTHLARQLLPLWQRYPVLWFHNKPKPDPTLRGLPFHIVRHFPSRAERVKYDLRRRTRPESEAWLTDPEWYQLQLPPYRWTPKGRRNVKLEEAQRIAGSAIDHAYQEGSWVLVFDEVKVLAGREEPHLNVPAPMIIAWEQGRSQPLTLIAGTQSPSLAPPPMYDQARHIYLGRIQDTYRQERLSEIGGDTKRIRAILPTLQGREFLYVFVGREQGETDQMWVIQAPPR
jgi:hypothetical protein